MKANRVSIVVYGHDEHLLATRQWVLQSRGYRVFTGSDLKRIKSISALIPVKLLILCHTLSAEEGATATTFAKTRWPGIKTLALDSDGTRMPDGLLGQLMHTMDGPERLLSVVNEIVGRDLTATDACPA